MLTPDTESHTELSFLGTQAVFFLSLHWFQNDIECNQAALTMMFFLFYSTNEMASTSDLSLIVPSVKVNAISS